MVDYEKRKREAGDEKEEIDEAKRSNKAMEENEQKVIDPEQQMHEDQKKEAEKTGTAVSMIKQDT